MSETFGLVGAGQLARMTAKEARTRYGFQVVALEQRDRLHDNEGNRVYPPAEQVGARILPADSYYDEDALAELVRNCDYVTYDLEHIGAAALLDLVDVEGAAQIHPSPETLSWIQDKLHQKSKLALESIPVPEYRPVDSIIDVEDFIRDYPSGAMLKARRGGYDGRGVAAIKTQADLEEFLADPKNAIEPDKYYIEQLVDLRGEISVLIAIGADGESVMYDPVDSYHENGQLDYIVAGSRFEPEVVDSAKAIGMAASELFKGRGVFAIEMLVDHDNNVLVNEIAPRVHNTYHHTLGAAATSQFDQSIRAVAGWPLGDTTLDSDLIIMKNILGRDGKTELDPSDFAAALSQGAIIEWYGKDPRPERKLGDLVLKFSSDELTPDEAVARANSIRDLIPV